MPLYNKAPYVRKTLDSVWGQTCQDWELVIVDDGSRDNSAAIVEQWISEKGSAFRGKLIRQGNQGVSVARNNGVRASHGKYLCFLDADDWWAPDFLQEMQGLIDSFSDAGIYGTAYFYHKNGRDEVRMSVPTGYINYFAEYARGGAMTLWTGAVCVPRNVFDTCGGFQSGVKLGEDFLLWARIAMQYKVAFLMKPLAYYNQDVDAAGRGIGHLYPPEEHMLWHLDEYAELEQTDSDYKRLVDKLRMTGLKPYWLSDKWHEAAALQLQKVDWSRQSSAGKCWYSKPLWYLRLEQWVLHAGSVCKQKLINMIR